MKKYFLPLIILMVLCLTGCYNVNKGNVDDVAVSSLKTKAKPNQAFKGYKIYVLEDMNLINDSSNNIVLKSFDDKYYLYVDITGYYKKIVNDYKINEENAPFYSKILNSDDGSYGYILVTKCDDKYFTEVMYNYAKIEVLTNNYKTAIAKSLIILNSISYNDKIIDSLIKKNVLEYNEEKYDILGPSNETTDFLEWVADEDPKEDNKKLDEDIIDLNEAE